MSQEISSVLEQEEKIVWQGVISRKAIIYNLVFALVVVIGLSVFPFSQEIIHYTSNGASRTIAGMKVGWVILIVGVALSLFTALRNFITEYAITNKRVLTKTGLIGIDFNSIYFTQIRNANVSVGLVDKVFSIGTINIDTGKIETVTSGSGNHRTSNTRTAYDKLLHINNPYEVYKYFQTTLTDREESLYSGRADKENHPSAYLNNTL